MALPRIYFLTLCLSLLLSATGQAQVMTWDEFLNIYAESTNGDTERLEELHESPININTCTSSDLQQIPFISTEESDSILSYIRKNGPILSAGELFSVNKLSYDSRKILPLFVRFDPPPKKERSLWQQIVNGSQELSAVTHIPFYLRRGFKHVINRKTGATKPPRYAGHPVAGAFRYRSNYSNRLQIGFTAKNDYGEPFAQSGNALFDSYSGYIVSKNENKFLQCWALGDFKTHIAKGLTAGIGFMNSGTALLVSRHDHGQGFFAHTGTDEYAFQRGAAAKIAYGNLGLMAFASIRHLDGRLQGDSLLSINTSGYHRLPLELERKNNVVQTATGVSADMQYRQFHFGISGVYTRYNHPFFTGALPYQQNNMKGKDFANYGVHYKYDRRKLNIGGETALTNRRQIATLHDIRWQLPENFNIYAQHRYYGRRYHAPLAHAYAGSGNCKGEHGLMLGIRWIPFGKWTVLGFVDGYRMLGPSYKALTSANGYTTQLQATYKSRQNLQFSIRYRLRSRQESSKKHPILRYAMKHSLRLQTDYSIGALRCITSLDGCLYKPSIGRIQKGGMIAERISFSLAGFNVASSFVAFHTQGYESSLYFYQPALLYARSYSNFFYHGHAATCTIQRTIGKHLDIACKFTLLHYTDRDQIGSGDNLIDSSGKHDLSIQLRWLF